MKPLNARLIVFMTGLCLMLVELVSGRVVAPYLGVSVYTWTAVIGVTLLGVTAGNYLGGQYADKFADRARLGLCFCLAGFLVLLSNYLAPLVGGYLASHVFFLWFKTVSFSLLVFFPSALFLSAIMPQVAKLALHDVATVGRGLGSLYAWNALGSIVGTFLAGYMLIALVGTKLLLTLTALVLVAVGIAVAWPKPIWKQRLSVVVLMFFVGDLLVPGICLRETNYYCIRLENRTAAGMTGYVLRLDHLIHSYIFPDDPQHVGYAYENVYANLIAYRFKKDQVFSTFFVGGGGYVLPRYLNADYASSSITVAEIDPGVTAVNHDLLQLPTDTRIQSANQDARVFLDKLDPNTRYDLVFGDAFNDFSVPYHLTTVEFHRILKSHMNADGVYALNIIDDARYGQFLAAMVRTLGAVWKYVYIAPQNDKIDTGRNTIVLLATDTEISRDAWNKVPPQTTTGDNTDIDKWNQSINLLNQSEVDDFMNQHPVPALTDDFVPTDRYLAPVFVDAY